VEGLIEVLAALLAALSAAAALVGAWAWWQVRPLRGFWVLLRASQAAAVAVALVAAVAAAGGERPDDGLFWIYALIPIGVNVVAEQIRVLAAQSVLDARGIENAQALAAYSDADQQSVVFAILRREIGVMTLTAGVICFLALRAMGTAAGL
jgi:subtilisin family serine protease